MEIRLTLNRSGNYEEAGYQIGYIQMEGSGEVYDKKKVYLVNREMQPLDSIAELDDSDPCRQVFTLFYHNRSSKNAEIKFVIADNFHQERELEWRHCFVPETKEYATYDAACGKWNHKRITFCYGVEYECAYGYNEIRGKSG